MWRTLRFPGLLISALALVFTLAQAVAGGLSLQPTSKLWLEGKSTVHNFKSTASSVEVTFHQDEAQWAEAKDAAAIERLIRAKTITSMEVTIPVKGLKSGKSGLDKNMYKALLEPKHPKITFRMTSYEVADGATAGSLAIDAKGMLTVAGVEREVRVPVTAIREGDQLRLKGRIALLMSQFNIKPPVMMLGAMKTADQVVVGFDFVVGTLTAADVSKAQ